MLSCTGLDFYYGAERRLKDLSFTAKKPELVGLFGHNGSGKTTLLKMLGASLPIKHGAVHFCGESVIGKDHYIKKSVRKNLGVLFQGRSSDEKLSSAFNLRYAAKLMGVHADQVEEKVDQALMLANLKDRAHDPIKKLSGGMARRLELYRTFLHTPQLVLLDEPTAGLDVAESNKFFAFLKNYQHEHHACVLMATHRPSELLACDRVIMIIDGEIKAFQAPKDMLSELNYLRCSLHLGTGTTEQAVASLPLFEVEADEAEGKVSAKILKDKLDDVLTSSLLKNGTVKGFAIERPSLADVYQDLKKRMRV